MKILVENLSVRAKTQFLVKEINLVLGDNQALSIIGPSGSGKTSLVKGILGLIGGVLGRIYANDQLIQNDLHALVPLSQRGFGYIPQELALWPHLPVKKTLKLAYHFSRGYFFQKKIAHHVWLEKIMIECGLSDLADKIPSLLSGGEKQRLALARALVCQPRLLILDEPFSGLDVVAKIELIKLITKLRKLFGFSLIFISHDLSESLAMGERIMIMEKGRQIWFGNKEDLSEERFLPHWNPFITLGLV